METTTKTPEDLIIVASPQREADIYYATRFRAPDPVIFIQAKGKESLELYIPAAQVRGSAKANGDGEYEAVLHHNGDKLACTFRPTSDGEGIVLFLSPEPFHQLTYARPNPSGDRPGRPPRKKKPEPPKLKPKPSPKPHRPPAEKRRPTTKPKASKLPKDHGRKTIFDF